MENDDDEQDGQAPPPKDSKNEERPELTPHNLGAIAALQCTQEEAASFFKVSKRTIIRKLKQPKFLRAWEEGKARGRMSLRRLQWRHASGNGSSAVAMTKHLSAQWLNERDRVELAGSNGGPIPFFDVTKLKDMGEDELEALDRALDKLGMKGALGASDDALADAPGRGVSEPGSEPG